MSKDVWPGGEDLRRARRVCVCCRVDVLQAGGVWTAVTEDLGARGCRIVTAREPRVGTAVRLRIGADVLDDELEVTGRVAWSGGGRAGLVFANHPSAASPAAWVERLARADPPTLRVRAPLGEEPASIAEARARRTHRDGARELPGPRQAPSA